MKKLIALLLLAIACAAYYWLAPSMVLKRATEKQLQLFAEAVATKDRMKIREALGKLLTEDAKVKLEISFYSISHPAGGAPAVQDFTKETFIPFIDNVLYSLTDYFYKPRLDSFTLSEDGKSAAVKFSSQDWAEGASYYNGIGVAMRFISEPDCDGTVRFEPQPVVSEANCRIRISTAPRADQMDKLKNPEVLRGVVR